MPQVDLSSVCCAQDRKVACETLSAGDDDSGDETPPPPVIDYAPESFWLSKDAELDWLDQNAFIERKDSGKGGGGGIRGGSSLSIQIPTSGNLVSNSQRYSVNLKTKASIIGLPKPQKTNYAEAKNRRSCRPPSIRLFPKRSESVGSSKQGGAAPSEPSSPKVSCMGRVRSRKDRSRRGKNRKKTDEPAVLLRTRSVKVKDRKTSFWKNFRSMFRSKGHKTGCRSGEPGVEPVQVQTKGSSAASRCNVDVNSCSEINRVEPPGLGGVKRFVSGRRSDAWAADLEVVNDVAKSEPLKEQRGPIWRRREKGPPKNVEVERDWKSVGPASV